MLAHLSGRVPAVSMAIVQSDELETAGRDCRALRHLIRQVTSVTTFIETFCIVATSDQAYLRTGYSSFSSQNWLKQFVINRRN